MPPPVTSWDRAGLPRHNHRCSQEFVLGAWQLGQGRRAEIETPKAAMRNGTGKGCPLPCWQGGLGERRKLLQRGLGHSTARAENECWCICSLNKHIWFSDSNKFDIFAHIFSCINIQSYYTWLPAYMCPCYTAKTVVKISPLPLGGLGPQTSPLWLRLWAQHDSCDRCWVGTVDNHGNKEITDRDFHQMPWMLWFCQNAIVLRFHKNILFLMSIIWTLLCEFNTKIFTFPLPLPSATKVRVLCYLLAEYVTVTSL